MTAGNDSAAPWIAPDEPPPFELVNGGGAGRALLVCDHASKRIPRRLGDLGVSPENLERHIAWDIGAADVARRLSAILDAPLLLSGYSRLVVDCNRPLDEFDSFTVVSEDVKIPGNEGITDHEREQRAAAFFWPYQQAVHRLVKERTAGAVVPLMVSVHSFTPSYLGRSRPWHIGVHYRWDDRCARLALEALRADGSLCVGDNEPYPLALNEDFTVPVHAETRGMPYVLFEIRQDLISDETGVEAWARRLGTLLSEAMANPLLDDYKAPATDVRAPRFA